MARGRGKRREVSKLAFASARGSRDFETSRRFPNDSPAALYFGPDVALRRASLAEQCPEQPSGVLVNLGKTRPRLRREAPRARALRGRDRPETRGTSPRPNAASPRGGTTIRKRARLEMLAADRASIARASRLRERRGRSLRATATRRNAVGARPWPCPQPPHSSARPSESRSRSFRPARRCRPRPWRSTASPSTRRGRERRSECASRSARSP